VDAKPYFIPKPIVDKREARTLEGLVKDYRDLIADNGIKRMATSVASNIKDAATGAASLLPDPIQEIGSDIGEGIAQGTDGMRDALTSNVVYEEALARISDGIRLAQARGHAFTVDPKKVIERAQRTERLNNIQSIDELCLLRSYQLRKSSSMVRTTNLALAVAEGGATGLFGLSGVPVSLVASTFLCLCVVESVACRYGFDVQHNDAELVIAATVFANGLTLRGGGIEGRLGRSVSEIMAFEVGTLTPSGKEYAGAVKALGLGALFKDLEATSRMEAKRTLQQAGTDNLEEGVFRAVFEQVGKYLAITSVGKAMPVAAIFVGAAIDATAMSHVTRYAENFYQKRFITEKADNIAWLSAGHPTL
jgi:hypothetical protein